MGVFTTLIAYKVGKRRGKRKARNEFQPPVFFGTLADECVHYESFCKNYGSCDGQTCEYEL